MDDRELLELAAKATGLKPFKAWDKTFVAGDGSPPKREWNPLTDDGDALRLAVKLGFQIDINDCGLTTVADGEIFESCADDPYAATRRAIVRAAAEIGKHSAPSDSGRDQ